LEKYFSIAFILLVLSGIALFFLRSRNTEPSEIIDSSDQDKFSLEFLTILSEIYPDVGYQYDAKSDTISRVDSISDERGYTFYLGNLRNRALEMGGKERKTYLRDTILVFTDNSEITSDELKNSLYLRARTVSEISLRNLYLNNYENPPKTPAILNRGNIAMEIVMDIPNAIRTIDLETLQQNDMDLETGLNLAATNLLKTTPQKTEDIWEKIDENIWISKLNDDYDAARLFTFPGELYLPFDGPLVIFAPAHSVALISSSQDEEILSKMVDFGTSAAETHRPLSQALWQAKAEGWVRLTSTDRTTPAGAAYFKEQLTDYLQQREILEQKFEKDNIDIFVPTIMTFENDKDEITTFAVLVDDHTYLPKVNRVVLDSENISKGSVYVEWDDFTSIIGEKNMNPVPDLIPPRYDFDGQLTKEKKKKLLEVAEVL